ncbi:hypothetical protein O7628_00340 [Micromonospora sp. WMMD956]|uniref:hypothetical protein n=1 Tax=Micromonospora sp. WMMD956 TaxID=3016108 RepID=UPI002416188C|nr:hypothetical protein [Micromonospora sp. WMMD956]MDG4813956.1 hypothetical protein [Micromonospora sp. WMMD956]
MTSVHRPMSTWVARLGTAGSVGPVNDGHRRADARTLPWFETTWSRVRAGEPAALALIEEGTGTVVVELDNYSVPIPVSEAGLTVVVQAEREWPAITESSDWSALAFEPIQLRYLLLRRLNAEAGAPPPWLFHILDWHRVDELAAQITRRLTGGGDEPLIVLRHHYSPAVPGLTSALEQIDAGYREGNAEARYRGLAALLTAVRAGDVDRLPRSTRAALLSMLAAVAAGSRMLGVAVRETARQLAGDPFRTYLTSELLEPLFEAAAAGEDREQETTPVGEPGFALSVTRSVRRRLLITARVAPGGDDLPSFLHVRVIVPGAPGEDRQLWISLRPEGDALTGTVDIPLPPAAFEVTVADVPVTAAALRFTAPDELLDSIRAADFASADVWLDTGDALPDGHPVREAARRFEEEQ